MHDEKEGWEQASQFCGIQHKHRQSNLERASIVMLAMCIHDHTVHDYCILASCLRLIGIPHRSYTNNLAEDLLQVIFQDLILLI